MSTDPVSDRTADVIVERTTELVAVPSYESEAAVQDRIAARLRDAGFDCRLDEVEPGRPNLVAVRGTGGPLLCSHADTQLPFAHPDPLTARRVGDTLVGRGVLDAKGQIAALLAAVAARPAAPAVVLITCDEEFGGAGSERARLPAGLDPAAGGIVLEPTGLRVCAAQAGNIEVDLRARGRAVHMAEPDRGVSALERLHDALDALRACPFLRATHPLLPRAWSHVARVEAGEHLWRLPATASAQISLAVLPGVDPVSARAQVESALRWAAERASGGLSWTIPDVNEPIAVPTSLPVVGRLRAAGADPRPAAMRSWTDAANLLLTHGLPCVVFGAGELASAHSDHEWVRLDDLVRLSAILARLLETWPTAT